MFDRWSPGYGARQRFLLGAIQVYIIGKRHLVGSDMNDDLFEAILTTQDNFFFHLVFYLFII